MLEQWLFQRALMRKGPPMVIECWPNTYKLFIHSWLGLVCAHVPAVTLAPVSNPFPVEMTYA